MRFVLDQQLPQVLALWLVERGHHAEQVGAIIMTKDQDFATRRRALAQGPIVVWLRKGNVTNLDLMQWFENRWPTIERAIVLGDAIIEVR